jgi:hypothetical protein
MTDSGSHEAKRLFVDELRWQWIVEKAVAAFKQGLRTSPSGLREQIKVDDLKERLAEFHQRISNALSGPMGSRPPPRPSMSVTLADGDTIIDAMIALDRATLSDNRGVRR